jgi:hypothetical protein
MRMSGMAPSPLLPWLLRLETTASSSAVLSWRWLLEELSSQPSASV